METATGKKRHLRLPEEVWQALLEASVDKGISPDRGQSVSRAAAARHYLREGLVEDGYLKDEETDDTG